MQILFAPSTVTADEWAEIKATVASLRGDEFAYDDSPNNAIAPSPANTAPAAPVAQAPAPAAPVAAVPASPPMSEQLIAAAAAAKSPVEVDSTGLPWDARIHSKPPVKTKDDVWRKKRGIDEAVVASVTAELRAALSAPPAPAQSEADRVAPVAPSPASPPAETPGETNMAAQPAIAVEGSPAPAPAPAIAIEGNSAPAPAIAVEGNSAPAPASPETAVAAAPTTAQIAPAPTPDAANMASGPAVAASASNPFAELMKKVVSLQAGGHLSQADVVTNAQALGLTGIRDLAVRPDLIPSFEAMLPALPA